MLTGVLTPEATRFDGRLFEAGALRLGAISYAAAAAVLAPSIFPHCCSDVDTAQQGVMIVKKDGRSR